MQVCTSSQITTPTSHHSVFTGRMPFLPPTCRTTTHADNDWLALQETPHRHLLPVLLDLVYKDRLAPNRYPVDRMWSRITTKIGSNFVVGLPIKMAPLLKWPQDNDSGKVKMAPTLFTNNTSSFNNNAYEIKPIWLLCMPCLQCFDAVGWVAGRASGL